MGLPISVRSPAEEPLAVLLAGIRASDARDDRAVVASGDEAGSLPLVAQRPHGVDDRAMIDTGRGGGGHEVAVTVL